MDHEPDEETVLHRPNADRLDAPIEAPLEDAAEQQLAADPGAEEDGSVDTEAVLRRGLEVGEWDAAEQERTAAPESDDYR
jgi:hypothetical protein